MSDGEPDAAIRRMSGSEGDQRKPTRSNLGRAPLADPTTGEKDGRDMVAMLVRLELVAEA